MRTKNTIHDEKLAALNEDPDFKVAEIDLSPDGGDVSAGGEEARSPSPPKKYLFIGILAALALCVILMCLGGGPKKKKVPERSREEISEDVVSVTEAGSDVEELTAETEKAKPDGAKPETEKNEDPAPKTDISWQEDIFGYSNAKVIMTPIKVSGLTENEKTLTGFRESDFVKSLSSFLTTNNIQASGVTFKGSIACSAAGAAAYTADIAGVKNKRIVVLFFPKYPGKYLFALEDVPKEEKQEKKAAPSQTEKPAQTTVTIPQQTAVPTSQTQSEDTYDAMKLKLTGVSSELGNYLANPYELQYGLYDYLYHHGVRNATSAQVTDYYIDSDEREATIQISISGSGNVTVLYDRDANSYSYQ